MTFDDMAVVEVGRRAYRVRVWARILPLGEVGVYRVLES